MMSEYRALRAGTHFLLGLIVFGKLLCPPTNGEEEDIGFSANNVGVGVHVAIGVGLGIGVGMTNSSFEPVDGIPPTLHGYIIGTSFRAD